jgi:hypothetical protein
VGYPYLTWFAIVATVVDPVPVRAEHHGHAEQRARERLGRRREPVARG